MARWVKFTRRFDFDPKPGVHLTFKACDDARLVPEVVAKAAIAEGAAEETTRPQRKD